MKNIKIYKNSKRWVSWPRIVTTNPWHLLQKPIAYWSIYPTAHIWDIKLLIFMGFSQVCSLLKNQIWMSYIIVGFQESISLLAPLCCTHSHSYSKAFSISYFSACMCLWPHKAGTVGCRRSESMMCVWGILTCWDIERERDRERKLEHF